MNTFRLLPVLGAMLMSSFVLSSCDKDEIPINQPGPNKPYLPLQVGNYWVYQQFEVVDSSGGKVTTTQVFDSCYIEKDTMIEGAQYFKYIHKIQGADAARFYRDSANYLVDYDAGVVFSAQDSTVLDEYYQMLNATDTLARVSLQVSTEEFIVSTPTDNNRSRLATRTFKFMQPNPTGEERYLNTYYSAGVGIVKETLPYNYNQYKTIERRLVRARVQ